MKVLLVDDKSENLYLLQSILKAKGYESVSAKNGVEAYELALNGRYDLIISDILMPVMDGFTFCRECKKNQNLRNIPFIFYTATYTDPKDEEFGLNLGVDKYIIKPQEPDILIAMIEEVLEGVKKRSSRNHGNDTIQFSEEVMLKEYNATLIHKLEDRMRQTEENEKSLRTYVRELEENIQERINTEQALRESEERYRLVQENSMDAILLTSPDGSILSTNRAACKMFGMTENEICRLGQNGVIDISDQRLQKLIEECNQTGKAKGELTFLRKDKSKFLAEVSTSIYKNSEGDIRSSMIIRDVTERKRAEEILQVSEERYRSLFENMVEGYSFCKMIYENGEPRDYVYLETNRAFSALTGLKNVIGKRVSETIPGIQESDPELIKIYGRVAATAVPEQFEIFVNALQEWFSISVYSPQKEFFVAVFDVVTKRKRAEENLKESERFARATIDALSSHIAILDEKGTIIAVNKAWKEFGKHNHPVSSTTYEGINYLSICDSAKGGDADYGHIVAAGIRQVMSGQEDEFVVEYPCHSPHEQRWFVVRVTRFYGEGPLRIVVAHENITERKLAENALQQREFHYRELFESNPQPMWVFDVRTLQILSVNDTAVNKYGYSREQFLSMTINDIRPEDDVKPMEQGTKHSVPSIGSSKIWRHKLHSGEIIFVEIISHSFNYHGVKAHLVLANDVTERIKMERSLRENEERLRLSIQAANIGLFDLNVQTGETIVNSEYASQVGYDPVSFVESQNMWIERLHPDDKQRAVKVYTDYLAGEIDEYNVEFRQRTKNGDWKWILSLGKITEYDVDGNPLRMLGTHTDITHVKNAEESQLLQLTALETAANGIMITSIDGTIVWANKAFTKITGFALEEVINKNPRILKSGIQSSEYYKDLWKTILAGNVWTGEIVNKRKDGTFYTDEMTITPVRNAQNVITHFVTVKQDITERKKTYEQIERQALLLDEAQDAIILRDLNHTILYWNKGAERVYGWNALDVVGKNARLLLNNDIKKYDEIFEELHTKGNVSVEVTHYTKEQKEIHVYVRFSIIYNIIGNPESILSISTDITEKKKLEIQFLRSQRLDSLGTLAGGIAHDLNNVLAPIMLSIEVLKKTYVSEQSQKMLSMIDSSARRGADIVKQILIFSRGLESNKSIFQSRHLITDLYQIFKETFPRSITLYKNIPKNIPTILADPTQFQQVLMNLCVNARDAMPNGGTLTISAEEKVIDEQYSKLDIQAKPGRYVMYSVVDTGVGIPDEDMDKIFDPFFTTKDVGKGTGLGLSTVHTIVKNHDGFIETKSEVGFGTTFCIYFPIKELHEESSAAKAKEDRLHGNGELILVVDDELSVCEVTKQTLETFNYRVITAAEGTEALAIYAEKKTAIDLVITDMMMPILDGPHLVQALRKMNPSIKIIGSSGMIDKGDYDIAELNMNSFILKPYSAEDLLICVDSVFKQL